MSNLHAKLVLIISLPLLSACVTAPDAENRWSYVCPDGYEFTVEFSRDNDDVVFSDVEQKLDLERRETASGARYTDGSFVFWTKGQMALIRRDGETLHQDCMGDFDGRSE